MATATETSTALEGLDIVKFFPAEVLGGVAALTARSAPFDAIRFIPTGGVSADTMESYLRLPSVLAVGGSWHAPPDVVRAGRFDEVIRRARRGGAVRSVRRDTHAL